MKRFFIFALIIFSLSLCIEADTYIKLNYHSDGYYNYGKMVPSETWETAYWMGDKKMAYVTDDGKLIFNQEKKRLYVVNKEKKTVVEISIPVDLSKAFDKGLMKYYSTDQSGGTVKPSRETKKIGNWKCAAYDLTFWVEDQNSRFEDQEEKRWVTHDVPFDLKMFQQFNALRYDMYHSVLHWQKPFVAGLKTIEGFPVLCEIKVYIKGKARKSKLEAVEMMEKKAPADIFSIPADYTRKKQVALADWMIIAAVPK